MIANIIENAQGVMTGVSRAATAPLSGRIPAPVTPIRRWAQLCPQAPMALAPLSLEHDGVVLAGLNDGPVEKSARTDAPQKFGFTQYGTALHHSGTRVWKPPV